MQNKVGDVDYFVECIRLGGFNVGWNIKIVNYDVVVTDYGR